MSRPADPPQSGHRLSRRSVFAAGAGAGFLLLAPGLASSAGAAARPTAESLPATDALAWMDVTYELVRRENLSPPAAARLYAYATIAMYEAVVPASTGLRSVAGQLKGLRTLPKPSAGGQIDWLTAMTTAVSDVLAALLPFQNTTSRSYLADSRARFLAQRVTAGIDSKTLAASSTFGSAVGKHLIGWAGTDGYAGIVNLAYTPPTGNPALWESTPPNYRPAIEPYWGRIRPMLLTSADEVHPAEPVAFDPDPTSAFGRQAKAPYDQSFINTAEQQAIARFWTDNPGSFTPPLGTPTGLPAGHWLLITSIAARTRNASLAGTVEAYVRVGVALHEAFLNCWTWKYRYNLLRPITYIRRYVDPAWNTFVNTPQFPEYSSGHSVGSPAAASQLTKLFGVTAYSDTSGVSRGFPARNFASFSDAAGEAAQSRLYGGIHYPMAIEGGYTQGEEVGALVSKRLTTRR